MYVLLAYGAGVRFGLAAVIRSWFGTAPASFIWFQNKILVCSIEEDYQEWKKLSGTRLSI